MMSVPPQNTKTQLSQKGFTTTPRYMTRVTSSLKLRTLTNKMWHQSRVSNSSSSRDNVSSSPQNSAQQTNKQAWLALAPTSPQDTWRGGDEGSESAMRHTLFILELHTCCVPSHPCHENSAQKPATNPNKHQTVNEKS